MKAFVNTHALSSERFDSARLGVLAMIAHPLPQPGSYLGAVMDGEINVGRFLIDVQAEHTPGQVDLDLHRARPGSAVSDRPAITYKLKTGGYLMLLVSQGAGGFRVVLDRVAEEKKGRDKAAATFDSTKLGKGDLFLLTLLRPGRWRMSEPGRGGEGTIVVSYPVPGKQAYRPAEPVWVKLRDRAFEPDKVQIGPAQTVVFAIETEPVSVVVSLGAPDDGKGDRKPPPGVRRRVRWTNPSRKESPGRAK